MKGSNLLALAALVAAPGVRLNIPTFDVGLSVPLILSAEKNVSDAYDFSVILDASVAS